MTTEEKDPEIYKYYLIVAAAFLIGVALLAFSEYLSSIQGNENAEKIFHFLSFESMIITLRLAGGFLAISIALDVLKRTLFYKHEEKMRIKEVSNIFDDRLRESMNEIENYGESKSLGFDCISTAIDFREPLNIPMKSSIKGKMLLA